MKSQGGWQVYRLAGLLNKQHSGPWNIRFDYGINEINRGFPRKRKL